MPDECVPPPALIDRVKALVASLSMSFASVSGGARAPIWETELVEKFKTADERGDWPMISDAVRRFENSLYYGGNFVVGQAIRWLSRLGVAELVDAVKSVRQTLVAVQIANALNIRGRLLLASASANPYIEFGCVLQALTQRPITQTLGAIERDILKDVLAKVALDKGRWVGWMRTFNAFPSRYPLLQESLGLALSSAPESAVEAYVSSIVLTSQPVGQDLGITDVSNCLCAFRSAASTERRAVLWKLAHARWRLWSFDQINPNSHLTGIVRSELDYAIVGYAYEVISESEREAALTEIRADLQRLDLQWFPSQTDITDAWYSLLSRFQIYALAAQIKLSTDEWLGGRKIVLPFVLDENRYAMFKYGMEKYSMT